MSQVEDRPALERRLGVSISVALKTAASRPLKAYVTAKYPVDRDHALRDIVDALVAALSQQYEIGQHDPGSQIYISNYTEPRSPYRGHPSDNRR